MKSKLIKKRSFVGVPAAANILASFLVFLSMATFGQDIAGSKILNGALTTSVVSVGGPTAVSFGSNLLVGKIKTDNTYWAYGGGINIFSNFNGNPNIIMIGPAIERGKFVKIIDKLFIAPYVGGLAQGVFGDVNGFNLNIYASPLRFMYQITNQFMLSAGFGSASLQFNTMGGATTFNVNGSMANNAGFGVFYTFK